MDSRSLVLGRGCSIRYLRGATKWSPGTHGNPATDRFSFSRTHCFPQVFMYPVMSQNKHDASVYHIPSGYLTWPWKITMLLIGKPSISMGHLYHGYVSHNQRVIVENLRFTRTYQSPRIAMGLRGSWGVFKVVTNPYVPRGVHWRVGHLGGKCEYFFFFPDMEHMGRSTVLDRWNMLKRQSISKNNWQRTFFEAAVLILY